MTQWLRIAASGLCLTLGFALAASAQDDKKKSGTSAEWVSLFDGKTLGGWEKFDLGSGGTSKWEVKDGALTGTGTASMLFSPLGTYKNFKFKAEIKINDKGNSGMYVRCPAKKGTFTDGYEIQINSTHGDPIKTGSVYTMVHVYKKIVPPDTWFTQEVQVVTKNFRGKVIPHIKISVNDEVLYEYLDHGNTWKDAGFFAFQQHDPGSVVQIRKVEVQELP